MFRSGLLVMIITMVSRVLGLVRAGIIAYYFGASAMTDAFFSAFKISNFFRQLLGEGALGSSFIPLYNERVESEGEENSKQFIYSILNLLFVFSTIVTILMIIFSQGIIDGIVSGFPDETKIIASRLLKIMSVYFVFISLSGMVCAILNNFKQFAVPASTSIFFNLAIILASMYFGKTYGIDALAYGVVIGGLFQFLVVLPAFFKIMKGYSFKIDWKDPYLKKIFIMICPMLIGIVARQVNTIVDQMFASYLAEGGVSALENATRLYLLPVGVFGVSISTVIFPALSKAMSKNDLDGATDNIVKGLNILLFLIIPSTAVLTFYAPEVIRLTLSYGKFDEEAVRVTSQALLYYSLGLYFYTAIYLMTRAFYSVKNSKYPVKFSIISIVINIVLNFLLIKSMAYRGLALSTSIASGVNFFLLLIVFRRKYINFSLKKSYIFFIKTFIITAIALIASYKIDNTIIKLVVFSAVYMLFWAKSLLKNKMEVF
ncbi:MULTISPECIES: murein biosynthesis integral membrane protein MurJ [Fusobacterium]|jgi:putative peptidoglycan lipid II flippase|uniref:Probable lipid II flippase MurJ n=2 Tax=Fusobacterium mortiferum TaxID=850 RepID=A0A414Q279_FUSMR|nr:MULTISPECIES: murein biosynthesis integral membrane protein MurJ [Fusobacterium]MCF2626754.1 murein biosynthesis integral membrane protein MurJ [Fusobacterium mortiferum]MCF2698161.1 murein biosynthesis integral membrane protein MurJ [Fusobacterium mortiferum]MCI7666127.1 murein biosynthesis integral membrane protein MurJ [Fusobacterium mortiferum]MDY4801687.1 murein biosynthesis integral membrane protein MurJ [Fusobacterium mortiferum]MSS60422.1 murein biosynthesis integral membrane protei